MKRQPRLYELLAMPASGRGWMSSHYLGQAFFRNSVIYLVSFRDKLLAFTTQDTGCPSEAGFSWQYKKDDQVLALGGLAVIPRPQYKAGKATIY